MFGSRKPGDDDYDAKLRPKDAVEMQQRVLAFMECKERWHMLKQRARSKSGSTAPLSTLEPVVSSTGKWSEEARNGRLERGDNQDFQLDFSIPQYWEASLDPMNDVQGHNPVDSGAPGMSTPQTGDIWRNTSMPCEAIGGGLNELFFHSSDYSLAEQLTSLNNSSFESFSSFDCETSPASPREQKRARNREAQRLRRTYCL